METTSSSLKPTVLVQRLMPWSPLFRRRPRLPDLWHLSRARQSPGDQYSLWPSWWLTVFRFCLLAPTPLTAPSWLLPMPDVPVSLQRWCPRPSRKCGVGELPVSALGSGPLFVDPAMKSRNSCVLMWQQSIPRRGLPPRGERLPWICRRVFGPSWPRWMSPWSIRGTAPLRTTPYFPTGGTP